MSQFETALDHSINEWFSFEKSAKWKATENFTALRHIALARLKNEKTLKRGIKTKRLKAVWDEAQRAKLLFDVTV